MCVCAFDQPLMHTVFLRCTRSWLQRLWNIKFRLDLNQKLQIITVVLKRLSLRRNKIASPKSVTCHSQRYCTLLACPQCRQIGTKLAVHVNTDPFQCLLMFVGRLEISLIGLFTLHTHQLMLIYCFCLTGLFARNSRLGQILLIDNLWALL